jgi:endogenous inhibitor of DNA gyrase (YacG/DUF329 family)
MGADDRPASGAAIKRILQAPCAWCGRAIEVKPRGRRPRFCSQACRQRDYELRTAAGRYGADAAAGRIAAEPAERVIERTLLAKHPTRPADWEKALAELAEQIRASRIDPAHHERIRAALHTVQDTIDADQLDRRRRSGPPPAPNSALDLAAQAVLASLRDLPGRTSIERLAALTGHDVDTIRGALAVLNAAGAIIVYRQLTGTQPVPIDPYALSPHANFHAHPTD